jgi:hypothetical protein
LLVSSVNPERTTPRSSAETSSRNVGCPQGVISITLPSWFSIFRNASRSCFTVIIIGLSDAAEHVLVPAIHEGIFDLVAPDLKLVDLQPLDQTGHTGFENGQVLVSTRTERVLLGALRRIGRPLLHEQIGDPETGRMSEFLKLLKAFTENGFDGNVGFIV